MAARWMVEGAGEEKTLWCSLAVRMIKVQPTASQSWLPSSAAGWGAQRAFNQCGEEPRDPDTVKETVSAAGEPVEVRTYSLFSNTQACNTEGHAPLPFYLLGLSRGSTVKNMKRVLTISSSPLHQVNTWVFELEEKSHCVSNMQCQIWAVCNVVYCSILLCHISGWEVSFPWFAKCNIQDAGYSDTLSVSSPWKSFASYEDMVRSGIQQLVFIYLLYIIYLFVIILYVVAASFACGTVCSHWSDNT